MLRYLAFQRIGVVLLENSLLVYCTMCGFIIRFYQSPTKLKESYRLFFSALVIAVIYQLFLHLADVYDFTRTRTPIKFVIRLGLSLGLASLFLSVVHYFSPALLHEHDLFPVGLFVSSTFLIVWHALRRFYFGVRGPRSNVLILGRRR